jgi:CubicO group peptidase (beta-lactamase class C family)
VGVGTDGRRGGGGEAATVVRRAITAMAALAAALVVTAGCGGSGGGEAAGRAGAPYHDPAQGWSAGVPAGWQAVATGPTFVRDDPVTDPTRLVVTAYPGSAPASALRMLASAHGIRVTGPAGSLDGAHVRWLRYRGRTDDARALPVQLAVAQDGADADAVALVARRDEAAGLTRDVLLPLLGGFAPGAPDTPASVLAGDPGDPAYWPTAGWRTASPASQGMDGARLDAMVAEIRARRLPVDSVTVVRHGYVVLAQAFGRFAAATLGEPYASGALHELQSATKSVTSMVLGAALAGQPADGVGVHTTVADLAAAVGAVPRHLDARKRAMTLEDLLTMRSGLAWRETGYAYAPGSGNSVVAMLRAPNWTRYVVDRPMADRPGTRFVYDTGGSHLVSGVVTVVTGRTADEVAGDTLFGPLGIRDVRWTRAPEGVTSGGFGLALTPADLAKLGFLYLHRGRWDGRQLVPADWVTASTTDHVAPPEEYGYLWWLDRADGYAFMAGLYGQLAVVAPRRDLVAVVTAHIPADVDASSVTRWLVERYVLPAAG